ncbi:MAG TPA: DUF3618 domain-containing protein [Gemmatimonadaceae bacterium]
MAETTADVRRDIEMTRERMSDTIAELERKLNVSQIVRDHPWPAIGLAVGAGLLLSGSGSDVKATAATVAATKGASSKLGPALDDIVARFMTGVTMALNERVDHWVNEVKVAIGAPTTPHDAGRQSRGFADAPVRPSMTSELRDTGDWAGNAPGGQRAYGGGSYGTQGPDHFREPPRAD